jgi:type II secretory pathway pseudopilin PulG
MGETKPTETKNSEPTPKKVVGRNVAVALGIICVILIASLAVVIYMAYSPDVSTSTTSLQSQINDLNSTYNSYVSTHTHTNDEYNSLNSQNTNLQNQVDNLTSTLNLTKSDVWVASQTVSQPAGTYNFWTHSATYAGYVKVNVESSNTDKTYIEVLWSSYGVNYDYNLSVGVSGTGVFPVLPSSVEARIGNSNALNGATETVTITYYY